MRPLRRRFHSPQQLQTSAKSSDSTSAETDATGKHQPMLGRDLSGGITVLRRHEPPAAAAKLQSSWVTALVDAQKTGVPPLQRALLEADFAVAEALLDAGASVKAEIRPPLASDRNNTCTLFSLARPEAFARQFDENESMHRNECITQLAILAEEASPQRRLELGGMNALTLAVACRAPDGLIAKLSALGSHEYADILNHKDACGRTPLSIATTDGNLSVVVLLLALGADPDRETGYGRTPLQLAVEGGHREIFVALLESGAGIHVGKEHAKPLDLCLRYGRADLLEACQQTSAANRIAVFKSLLAHGKSLFAGNDQAFASFIHWASPLLTDKRLAKTAIAAARTPGSAGKLALVCDRLATGFPTERLWALRTAAELGGDPEMIAFVSSRYPARRD